MRGTVFGEIGLSVYCCYRLVLRLRASDNDRIESFAVYSQYGEISPKVLAGLFFFWRVVVVRENHTLAVKCFAVSVKQQELSLLRVCV